ncbi:FecR domain-containing protein [Methylobacter sp.]|uniref:FecR family protein n=1 Tax=Methylobacter sp. TaxID=2051955 RepID=UPI0025F2E984|nr:FecR domain-containing protein [Methylobacter sp.]
MIIHPSPHYKTTMPIQLARVVKCYGLWLCLTIFALPAYAATQVVGHISFVKGSNAAQQPGAAPRILGNGTEIFQGDNIQTTERSFVIIEFTDGAKVTVRPNSNFTIDHYDSQSANKNAQLVLHQGGVNASTGDIAKDNPESFQIKTPTATVKSQSEKAEFNVRICDKACAEKETARTEQSVVARVVEIKGEVNAINRADKNAKERPLSLGNPLYNSDSIISEKDSYALLVFPDGEKVTLRADSELEIKKYNYQIKGQKDRILFRLVAGGLRAMTGSIGKNDHDAFALDTPVATIGIRGTITDTFVNPITGEFIQLTREGESYVNQDGVITNVPEGFKFVKSEETPGTVLPVQPGDTNLPEPGPETDKHDPQKVHEDKRNVEGGTITEGKSGKTSVETKDGTPPKIVKEGETNADGKTSPSENPGETDSNNNSSEKGDLFSDEPSNSLDGC